MLTKWYPIIPIKKRKKKWHPIHKRTPQKQKEEANWQQQK